MKKWLSLFSFLLFSSAWAQQVDFTKMSLSVEFDTLQGLVDGAVELQFVKKGKVDSIYLNGVRITYGELRLNGEIEEYEFDNKGIWLKPEEGSLKDTNSLFISYTARPRKGIYFIGWKDTTGLSKRQIWTQGQGIDHRHWIPHRDDQTDKLVVDIEVVFNSDYEVISNGELVTRENVEGGQTRWHYQMEKPMSSYLIAIAIGRYKSLETKSSAGTPLKQYFYPERFTDYNSYYFKNEEIHNFLQKEIGVDFPWQNYKQVPVQDFRHGAMENTTATIFGDFFLVDPIAFNDRNYTYVNAHELAHQWFGNLVTASGSDEHWLHEGFATYYQWLSEGNLYGKDYLDWERHKAAKLVFDASERDTVPLGNGNAGSNRFYQKGAWVLDMLNNHLGRSDFRKVMQHYLNKYAFGVVTTDSLNASIMEVTGKDFESFFQRWVHTAGEPVLSVESKLEDNKLSLDYEIKYWPFADSTLTMPVALHYENGEVMDTSLKIEAGSSAPLELPVGENEVDFWLVNPNMEVLAKIDEVKSYDDLEKQFSGAKNLLDRYRALKSMRNIDIIDKRKLLIAAVEDHKEHYAVRAEALDQLNLAKHKSRFRLFELALNSGDVQLQKEAVAMIPSEIATQMRSTVAKMRRGRSYELRENAINKSLDLDNPQSNQWLYDQVFKQQPGIPGHKVHITTLIYRVAFFKDKRAFRELIKYTSPGYDFLTRINAMQALEPVGLLTEEYAAYLFDALFNTNWKLRKEAKQILQAFNNEDSGREILQKYADQNESGWQDFQKRRVKRTFEANPL